MKSVDFTEGEEHRVLFSVDGESVEGLIKIKSAMELANDTIYVELLESEDPELLSTEHTYSICEEDGCLEYEADDLVANKPFNKEVVGEVVEHIEKVKDSEYH